MALMSSFYGGRRGASFVIVKSYLDVLTMTEEFSKGNELTEVKFDQYVLINNPQKNHPDNGKIFRRGYDYNSDRVLSNMSLLVYDDETTHKPKPFSAAQILESTTKTDLNGNQKTYKNRYELLNSYSQDEEAYFLTIEQLKKENTQFSLLAHGAEYIGTIIGPSGKAPLLNIVPYTAAEEKESLFESRKIAGSFNPKADMYKVYNPASNNIDKWEPHPASGEDGFGPGLIPGKYYNTQTNRDEYNDSIQWYCTSIRNDQFGDDTQAFIGFKFPYLVTEMETSERSSYATPDYKKDKQGNTVPVGKYIDTSDIKRVDDGQHPYYNKWHIYVPKGIKGDSLKNFKVVEEREITSYLGSFENLLIDDSYPNNVYTALSDKNYRIEEEEGENEETLIVKSGPFLIDINTNDLYQPAGGTDNSHRKILIYEDWNYDIYKKGEVTCYYLGDYNQLTNVDLQNGVLTFSFTHDDDSVFELKAPEDLFYDSERISTETIQTQTVNEDDEPIIVEQTRQFFNENSGILRVYYNTLRKQIGFDEETGNPILKIIDRNNPDGFDFITAELRVFENSIYLKEQDRLRDLTIIDDDDDSLPIIVEENGKLKLDSNFRPLDEYNNNHQYKDIGRISQIDDIHLFTGKAIVHTDLEMRDDGQGNITPVLINTKEWSKEDEYDEYKDDIDDQTLGIREGSLAIYYNTKRSPEIFQIPWVNQVEYNEETAEFKYRRAGEQEWISLGNFVGIQNIIQKDNALIIKYKDKVITNEGDLENRLEIFPLKNIRSLELVSNREYKMPKYTNYIEKDDAQTKVNWTFEYEYYKEPVTDGQGNTSIQIKKRKICHGQIDLDEHGNIVYLTEYREKLMEEEENTIIENPTVMTERITGLVAHYTNGDYKVLAGTRTHYPIIYMQKNAAEEEGPITYETLDENLLLQDTDLEIICSKYKLSPTDRLEDVQIQPITYSVGINANEEDIKDTQGFDFLESFDWDEETDSIKYKKFSDAEEKTVDIVYPKKIEYDNTRNQIICSYAHKDEPQELGQLPLIEDIAISPDLNLYIKMAGNKIGGVDIITDKINQHEEGFPEENNWYGIGSLIQDGLNLVGFKEHFTYAELGEMLNNARFQEGSEEQQEVYSDWAILRQNEYRDITRQDIINALNVLFPTGSAITEEAGGSTAPTEDDVNPDQEDNTQSGEETTDSDENENEQNNQDQEESFLTTDNYAAFLFIAVGESKVSPPGIYAYSYSQRYKTTNAEGQTVLSGEWFFVGSIALGGNIEVSANTTTPSEDPLSPIINPSGTVFKLDSLYPITFSAGIKESQHTNKMKYIQSGKKYTTRIVKPTNGETITVTMGGITLTPGTGANAIYKFDTTTNTITIKSVTGPLYIARHTGTTGG